LHGLVSVRVLTVLLILRVIRRDENLDELVVRDGERDVESTPDEIHEARERHVLEQEPFAGLVLHALVAYRPVRRDARDGETPDVRRRETNQEGTRRLAVEARGRIDGFEIAVEPSLL